MKRPIHPIEAMWSVADEIAGEAISAFSTKYPDVRLNLAQWQDLKEMIEREVVGHLSDKNVSALDV